MVLELSPLPDHAVGFSSWIEGEEPREHMVLLDPDRKVDADSQLKMCAWCKRIQTGPSGWLELEDALAELGLFNLNPLPKILHSVCRSCQDLVLREMEEAGH
jgi:hypothetical protein